MLIHVNTQYAKGEYRNDKVYYVCNISCLKTLILRKVNCCTKTAIATRTVAIKGEICQNRGNFPNVVNDRMKHSTPGSDGTAVAIRVGLLRPNVSEMAQRISSNKYTCNSYTECGAMNTPKRSADIKSKDARTSVLLLSIQEVFLIH